MSRVALLALALAACGPGRYLGQVRRAADAVDEARAAHADTLAPYWWTRATAYLHEARAIAAHADYQGAVRFSRLATEAANQAADEARLAEKDPQRRPLDYQGPVAPAKGPAPVAPVKEPVAPVKEPVAPVAPVAPAKDAP
jgi:hypothetical protein